MPPIILDNYILLLLFCIARNPINIEIKVEITVTIGAKYVLFVFIIIFLIF